MISNLSIKVKVIVLTIMSLFVLALSIAWFSIAEIKSSLMAEKFAALTTSRDSKAEQISNFFNERIGDISVLSKSDNVANLVRDLYDIEELLNFENNGKYPINDSLFKKTILKHENYFQSYAKEYGYYDIFIISKNKGHVIYTQAKESDFGENLKNGSLSSSGLGEVYQKVKNTKKITFVDMKPYAPSNGIPAMFLGAPVYLDNEFSAILVLQIPDSAINKVMQFREGYGKSQEDYLVGIDKLMRSDSFLDPKNHSLKASFANPTLGKVDTKASNKALNGESNKEIVMDYNGNPVLSAYKTVNIGDDLKWAILSEIDEAEVLEKPNYIRNLIIIISLVLFILITSIYVITINQILIKPLNKFQEGLSSFFDYLNRKSKDVQTLDDKKNDEIGNMAKAVNENIVLTKKGIEEDRQLIDETIAVLSEFEQGDLCQRLNISVSNPALMELKSVLNKMGENMENNIDNVLDILEQYSNYNYLNKIDTKHLKDHLFKLSNGVNELGTSITEMLVDNKANGLTLDNSSNILLENVDLLNKNSNEAAAALEETAAALEEITSNISNNTENVVKMSGFSEELKKSANEGEKLAHETNQSMDEINEQVTAINEAITVIDQIAFQTNILSLNAAVEAATAGEAGKGFAVVAQEVRNLASRSAEAAKEIKDIVENATNKANDGKQIASSMIEGYKGLNENIVQNTDLIKDIETASKEQLSGISQINDAINSLDKQTQQNAEIATQTHNVAVETDEIAKLVVSTTDKKEFEGKNTVQAKVSSKSSKNYTPKETTSTNNSYQKTVSKPTQISKPKEIISNVRNDDEWESF